MAHTDIQAAKVAEISNDTADVLDKLNEYTDLFKKEVIGRIERHWYNKNVTQVMPEAQRSLNGLSSGINISLASLGRALGRAANTWAQANGRAGYDTRSISENPRKIAGNYRGVGDQGYEGMDPDEIQIALDKGEQIKQDMLETINKLKAAGQKEGFRGGSMQANLDNVCATLTREMNKGIDTVLDAIASNTGTQRKNVIVAKDTTESEFRLDA